MGPGSVKPEVLEIADENFVKAWTTSEFEEALNEPTKGCLLAKIDDRIVGFLVYELKDLDLEIRYFAVAVSFQRQYVGTQIVSFLKKKLSPERLERLLITIDETDEISLKFFKSVGFKATLKKRAFSHLGRDGYQFSYKLEI